MHFQSNNLNKVRLFALLLYAILEILLQVVFRILFFITVLYWSGNNILARVDFIQSGINLQYITTYCIIFNVLVINVDFRCVVNLNFILSEDEIVSRLISMIFT